MTLGESQVSFYNLIKKPCAFGLYNTCSTAGSSKPTMDLRIITRLKIQHAGEIRHWIRKLINYVNIIITF